jgi:hypothetical protein
MDTLRNTGARHAQLHAMPRVWIAAKKYRGLDAMQLRPARDVSHLLRPFSALYRTRKTCEPGLDGAGVGIAQADVVRPQRRRIYGGFLSGIAAKSQ